MEKEEIISEQKTAGASDPRSIFLVAEDHLNQGRYEKAVEVCREGVDRFPDFLPGRLLLGRCYLEAGKISESQEQLESVAQMMETCSSVYKILSHVYLEKREIDKAMGALQKALYLTWSGGPPPTGVRENPLPGPATGAGETTRPVPILTKIDKEPAQPIRTDTLADIYLRQGHVGKALSILEEILQRDPGNTAVRQKYESLRKKRGGGQKKTPREKVLQELERWLTALGAGTETAPA